MSHAQHTEFRETGKAHDIDYLEALAPKGRNKSARGKRSAALGHRVSSIYQAQRIPQGVALG